MPSKRRIYTPLPDAGQVEKLAQAINVNPSLATILVQRGITDFDSAKDYFRPNLSDLHSPFLMKNMDKAVERLTQAIQQREKIMIYGDYDVDGTTSVALVYSFLQGICPDLLDFYTPDRYGEGYGISLKGIDEAEQKGISLIIALDCGIQARKQVIYAQKKEIDFIICDHHLPGIGIPEAVAVLDPKQKDCPYPYKELSGCGIGFKLMQAYAETHHISLENLYNQLDLLGLSISADIVSMTGENRILMFYGLQKINENPRLGIRILMELAELNSPLTVTDLVFGIAPRINAAGRMIHAKNAIKLMTIQNQSEAEELAMILNTENMKRQNLDRKITEEALQLIEVKKETENFSTVLVQKDWHKGVIGIVASRCIETYYRPTIILTENDKGEMTGSARSIRDFDIHGAILECSKFLTKFGGHHAAAGLSMKSANFPLFKQKFEAVCQSRLQKSDLISPIRVDLKLDFSQITPKFYRILEQFAPFGPQNMRPVFETEKVVAPDVRLLNGRHLKMTLEQKNKKIEAIAFSMNKFYADILHGKPFSICYVIEENEYLGRRSLQLNIKDIRF